MAYLTDALNQARNEAADKGAVAKRAEASRTQTEEAAEQAKVRGAVGAIVGMQLRSVSKKSCNHH